MIVSRRLAGALVGVLLAVVCAGACTAPPGAPREPIGATVVLDTGRLQGRSDEAAGVLRYRGIPYAAPPVGALRWAPPQPVAAWSGTLDAGASGPGCPRPAPGTGTGVGAGAEDCLRLDVTVPTGTRTGDRLPVLVWLPGPGAAASLDPARLARAGTVVVIPDHRSGIEGYFALPGLDRSGEFGLLDQQAALAWVRAEITAFGGDPARVALGGSGAGADSVCAQLASPAAVGLYSRAILQDSACTLANIGDAVRPGTGLVGDVWKPLAFVAARGGQTAADLGCPDPDTALACLRALPADALRAVDDGTWTPATGTRTVTTRPFSLVTTGDLARVPLLVGTTREAGAPAVDAAYPTLDPVQLDALIAASGPMAAPIAAGYLRTGTSPRELWAQIVTDRAMACPLLRTTQALATRAPVYAYEFAHPADAGVGADVPYLMGVAGTPAPAAPGLAERMVASWARFVADGSPGPDWPRFGPDGPFLAFTGKTPTTTSVAAFAAAHRCDRWTG